MEFIKKLRLYIKIIFVILLISVSTVSISKNVFADDIEKLPLSYLTIMNMTIKLQII